VARFSGYNQLGRFQLFELHIVEVAQLPPKAVKQRAGDDLCRALRCAHGRGEEIKIHRQRQGGRSLGLLLRPDNAKALYVFAHGAGAGMTHRFMEAAAEKLAGARRRDAALPIPLHGERHQAAGFRGDADGDGACRGRRGGKACGDLPRFAGGKSMGGRMTSLAAAKEPLAGVRGLIFFGFPLHAAGKPSADRAKHLEAVALPLLFLQGSRDSLADLKLLKPLAARLQRAELFVVEGGDHSFHMLKSSGRSDDEVLDEVAAKTVGWIDSLVP
jgi:predicted alpha/beta-hydrolase family hydrolase